MINRFRTFLAKLIVRHLRGPRSLLVAAWGWLAAEFDDLCPAEEIACNFILLDVKLW